METTRADDLRLQPDPLWVHFLELTAIARPSHEEGPARAHVVDWADRRGWESAVDERGNVVVSVPGTPGREGTPVVVLQAHLDMVCERDPGSPNDPREGRIQVVRDDDWLVAEGTTLGADNGIGVALAMAVAEDADAAHGPLELLFTVCEEQGLEGAKALDPALVSGRLLVNLDGTSDGSLTVGCAGSAHTFARVHLTPEPPPADGLAVELSVTGALGGHSGGDIHRGRANALKAMGHVLNAARAAAPVRVSLLEGGVSRNAIPREARAVIVIPGAREDAVREAVADSLADLRREHAGSDDGLDVGIHVTRAGGAADVEASGKALDLLSALPTGVVACAPGPAETVETSTSLNVARTENGVLTLASMTRSSSSQGLEDVVRALEEIAAACGANLEVRRSYPPWEPDLDAPLLASARRTFERLFGEEARLDVVHGGLECAVIAEKLQSVQMVSIGPTIVGPHAPGERVSVSATERAYRLLVALLDDLTA